MNEICPNACFIYLFAWLVLPPKNGPSEDALVEPDVALTILLLYACERVPWVRTKGAARPKSVNLTCPPAVIRTLSGLTSRCTTPWA